MTMTGPQNGLWFALAGFLVGLIVVVVIELHKRRRARRAESDTCNDYAPESRPPRHWMMI